MQYIPFTTSYHERNKAIVVRKEFSLRTKGLIKMYARTDDKLGRLIVKVDDVVVYDGIAQSSTKLGKKPIEINQIAINSQMRMIEIIFFTQGNTPGKIDIILLVE